MRSTFPIWQNRVLAKFEQLRYVLFIVDCATV